METTQDAYDGAHNQPTDVSELVETARKACDQRMFKEALGYASEALKIEPDNEQALLLQAKAHRGLEEFENAREALDSALSELRKKDGLDKALKHTQRAQKLAPNNEEGYLLEIEARRLQGDLAKAVRTARKAHNKLPESVSTIVMLSRLYASGARFREAEQWINKAKDLAKEDENVLAQQIKLLAQEARWAEAKAEANRVRSIDSKSAMLCCELALFYATVRHFEEAHQVVKEGLKDNPKSAALWFVEGMVLQYEGKFDEALKQANKILDTFSDNTNGMCLKGWLQANASNFEDAHKLLDKALGIAYYDVLAISTKADALLTEGFAAKAEELTTEFLPYFPDRPELNTILARVHLYQSSRETNRASREELLEQALKRLDHAIKCQPSSTVALQVKARVLFEQGNLEAAKRVVKEGLDNHDFSVGLRSEMGFLQLFGDRDLEEAENIFSNVVERTNTGLLAKIGLGVIAFQRKKYEDAEYWFDRVIEKQSFEPTALTNLAWTLTAAASKLDRDKYGRAEDLCRKVLDKDPENTRAQGCLGVIYAQRGKRTQAERYLRKVLSLDSSDTDNLVNLGALYSKMGRYEEARERLRDAIRQESTHARAHLELSLLWRKRERHDKAREHARMAFDSDPDSGAARRTLALLLTDQNRWSEAEGILREGLNRVEGSGADKLRLDLVRVLMALGDETVNEPRYHEALSEVSRIIDEGRNSPIVSDAFVYRGLLQLRLDQTGKARKSFESASNRDSSNTDATRYKEIAQAQLRLRKEQPNIRKREQILLGLVVLANLIALWWAFAQEELLSETAFVTMLSALLGLLIVVAVLPSVKLFKIATLEAQVKVGDLEAPQEPIAGPTMQLQFSLSAAPVADSRLYEI